MGELFLSRTALLDTVRRWVLTEQRLPGLFLGGYQSPVNHFEPSTLLKKFLTLATSKGGTLEPTGGNKWINGPATVSYVTSQIHWGRREVYLCTPFTARRRFDYPGMEQIGRDLESRRNPGSNRLFAQGGPFVYVWSASNRSENENTRVVSNRAALRSSASLRSLRSV